MKPKRWQQLDQLLEATLELPVEQRAAFLAEACAGDTTLQQEVESLLRAEGATEGFIETPVAALVAEALADQQTRSLVGERLGSYKILAPLGKGGMGEVYLAQDTRLGRKVALKLLPAQFTTDTERVRRFEQEGRAASALNHPNIITIHDIGQVDGVYYIATELIEGQTLRQRLADGPLQLREAVEVAQQAAAALAAAHNAGIIHRDIKPENIMLRDDGYVKVLDFGLAKLTEHNASPADSAADTLLKHSTQAGIIMGTVQYMSPEQARGLKVDARTDIFSLGVVLYEMIAGQAPFAGATIADVIAAILEHEPAPLTPPELQQIVSNALRKDRAARYQTTQDLLHELKNLQEELSFAAKLDRANQAKKEAAAGEAPTVAEPLVITPSSARILLGESKRHRVGVISTLALLIVTASTAYWWSVRNAALDSLAILPFVNASENPDMEYLSDGITESLINSLSQVPNLAVLSRNAVFRYKGRATDAQAVGQTLKAQAVLLGRVVRRGDSLLISAELIEVRNNRHLWGEQYNRKLSDILAVQEEISTEISEKLRFRLTGEEKKRLTKRYTQNTEAYQLYLRGRYHWLKKTPDGFSKGIEYLQKAIDTDPNYAPAYAALAALYNNMANYNFGLLPPDEAGAKAKAAAEKALQIDGNLASAHASLAISAYQWEWNWANAEKEFKRAFELDPDSPSTYEPSPASTYHWYAHYLMTMGRVQDSFVAGRRALELDPNDLGNNSHQGWHYVFTHEYDRAIEPLQKTIEMAPSFHIGQWYLGLAYEQKKAFPEAIAQFENCVRLTSGRPSMVALLGHAYATAGRKSEAQTILQQLRDLAQRQYVPPYPIAAIYAALGDKDEAFAWLEKAYDGHDSWMNYLGVDPRLDGLRADARFAALVRRVGLPQ